ncbi:MAG TPA: hypothetical protein VIF12_04265 [Micavibrio sp.]|jgi:hypothetical protein
MAVQFNPYAGQIQSAVANPFQQKDDSRSVQRDDSTARTEETRKAETSASESQDLDNRNSRLAAANDASQQDSEPTRTAGQRGSVLDLSV